MIIKQKPTDTQRIVWTRCHKINSIMSVPPEADDSQNIFVSPDVTYIPEFFLLLSFLTI